MEAISNTTARPAPRKVNFRTLLVQAMQLGLIVTSALVIWKTLMLVTGSEFPIMVVLSGSMEPGMHSGDLLFLQQGQAPFRTGEIIVFNTVGRDVPIVHRVLQVHERSHSDTVELLTKGDNNMSPDNMGIYGADQDYISPQNIIGRAIGILPQVGRMTIFMNDYPSLKYALIGLLGVLVVTNKALPRHLLSVPFFVLPNSFFPFAGVALLVFYVFLPVVIS